MPNIKFLFPHWGSESLPISSFIEIVEDNSFDGIEINLPQENKFKNDFFEAIEVQRNNNSDFILGLQQVFGVKRESPKDYLNNVIDRMESFIPWRPNFINSHTGKDHYSFDENCQIIDAIENFSSRNNIPVYHEIHRGRFTFHSQTIGRYLEKFPNLKFVGDFSHWCVVSESMLEDQEQIIEQISPHIYHLHSRVGHEQSPQVNHPFAPEWSNHLKKFTGWWKQVILNYKNPKGMTITPEFGPFPYMPNQPFTQEPISDQRSINIEMKDYLKSVLS